MARRHKTRVLFPLLMLGIGLAAGWWVARHGLPSLKAPAQPTARQQPATGDIHRVDFRNFSYAPDCVRVDGQTNPPPLAVRNGKYRHAQEADQVIFNVLSVRYGDLTGDGRDEAVVLTHCNLGGTGQFTEGMVYTMRAGKPVLLARVEGGDRAYGGLESLSVEHGRLVVERFATDDGPSCCPMYIETMGLRWNGSRLVQAGALTRRPAPAE